MKKRIISLLMTFCVVFSLMPASPARADHEEADITGGTRQSDGVPVYVYAETVYNGGTYKGDVEGLKLNNSGRVTIGKLIQQDLPQEKDGTTGKWPSYGEDSEQLKAVVKELDTDHFTYHDAGVVGCLDMVSSWTSLAGQYGGHDGYKGEKPGDPNNGSVRAYHLDGAIDVCKMTLRYGNSTGDVVKYYPKNAAVTRPAVDPTGSQWFVDWYGEDDKAYDFSKPITKDDLTLTAHWTRRSSGGSTRYTVTVAESGHGSTSADHKSAVSGTLVTVTAKPDDGYQVKEVTVTVNSTGKTVRVTDKSGGKFTFTMPAGAVTVRASFVKENPFIDMPSDSYYKDAVDWAEKNGITGGVSADAFAPDRICTRAQAVTFLWRAAGSPEPEITELPFAGVPMDSYYFKAVRWAVETGITRGTTDTAFSPAQGCARAQIVTFLYRQYSG